MKAEVIIHGFETSNNMKVRVALGFKEISYEFQTIDPRDRAQIQRLSGQHLTPVMVHGDRVLFDSAAILRYLEANFPGRPKLFGSSHREQWAIEDMELFGRLTLAAPMMEIVHHRVYGGTIDGAMQQRCADAFARAGATLIDRLEGREWLVTDGMTAADVTAGPVVYRVLQSKMFDLPEGSERVRAWVERVMAYDRYLA